MTTNLCWLCGQYPVDPRTEDGTCRKCDDHELGRHMNLDETCRRCDEVSE